MADPILIRALKSQPKILNFSNKKLCKLPKAIGRIDSLLHLQLKNNDLNNLPKELAKLVDVSEKHYSQLKLNYNKN